jgi:adenylate cyclase
MTIDASASRDVSVFEDFRLERYGGGLFRRDDDGAFTPVEIGSRALDILGVLAARAGESVSKDEIMAAVWPGTVVEDSNLTVQISALRRVLDRGRSNGSCIQTVSGRGYRFVAAVAHPAAEGLASRSVSETVRDHISERLPYAVENMGEHSVKNIARPGPVYSVRAGGLAGLPIESSSSTTSSSAPVAAPRLSIVVLPFTNLSDDREQQYFADGITDDLTTDLSRLENMFVISRNTAFTYKSKPVDTKQIGRELGVRYVLEGSVRRSGGRVRVNAQLIDAETDAHLWAERYTSHISELFALQDDITGRIAEALNLELIAAEAARPADHPDALDHLLRGRAAIWKPPSSDNYAVAIGLFERALALDPRSTSAQSSLAFALATRVLDQMVDPAAANIPYAERLVDEALRASPGSALAHLAKGAVLRVRGRTDEAIHEYETASLLQRNWATALSQLGWSKLLDGSLEDVIPLQEQALRLNPRDPMIGSYCLGIGVVHLLQSRTDEAILCFERARNANPTLPHARSYLAAAYAIRGEGGAAAVELDAARKIRGPGFHSSIAHLKSLAYFGVPTVRARFDATFFAGLRKAGVPEE